MVILTLIIRVQGTATTIRFCNLRRMTEAAMVQETRSPGVTYRGTPISLKSGQTMDAATGGLKPSPGETTLPPVWILAMLPANTLLAHMWRTLPARRRLHSAGQLLLMETFPKSTFC